MLSKCSKNKNVLIFLTYIWTFISYGNLHIVRLLWSLSKPHLKDAIPQQSQAYMDSAFLFAYAIGLFLSGLLSSKFNHSLFISIGMILTGVAFSLIGICGFFHTPIAVYIVLFAFNGLFQSTGWPCNLAVMSKWTPKKYIGLILVLF